MHYTYREIKELIKARDCYIWVAFSYDNGYCCFMDKKQLMIEIEIDYSLNNEITFFAEIDKDGDLQFNGVGYNE